MVGCNIDLGFPQLTSCTTLGVPVRRSLVFRGLYWDPPICGDYRPDVVVTCVLRRPQCLRDLKPKLYP